MEQFSVNEIVERARAKAVQDRQAHEAAQRKNAEEQKRRDTDTQVIRERQAEAAKRIAEITAHVRHTAREVATALIAEGIPPSDIVSCDDGWRLNKLKNLQAKISKPAPGGGIFGIQGLAERVRISRAEQELEALISKGYAHRVWEVTRHKETRQEGGGPRYGRGWAGEIDYNVTTVTSVSGYYLSDQGELLKYDNSSIRVADDRTLWEGSSLESGVHDVTDLQFVKEWNSRFEHLITHQFQKHNIDK